MQRYAGGSQGTGKGSSFTACQEHVGLFCTLPSDPVVVVGCSPCWQSPLVP